MAVWVRSVTEVKPGTFQLVGRRWRWNGVNMSSPASVPSLACRQWRRLSAKGPRYSSNDGALGSQVAQREP